MEKVVPEHLKHFLQCLCGASEHKLLRIVSIVQSFISMSSDAQKKMPKQVGLGVSLKASLRSREYITLLNKFGESVNYHEVLGIGAYWAEEVIERGDGYATISTNMFKYCAQATFDNVDYGVENASQHVTNTVIYQYCRNGEFKVILFSGLLHTLRSVLGNGDLQTNSCNSKTIWCILILLIVCYST